MTTKLIYLDHMFEYTSNARINKVDTVDGKTSLILDQTIFFPQGGGQPTDKGTIKNKSGTFTVESVTKRDDTVYHTGSITTGSFLVGDEVTLAVDKQTRKLNSAYHTAGHIIDYALIKAGYKLEPIKGFHVPPSAYVEYNRTLNDEELDHLKTFLEPLVNEMVAENKQVMISYKNLPGGPVRYVRVESCLPIACGGTHVATTGEIGHITIRKIKNEKGILRVSYSVL